IYAADHGLAVGSHGLLGKQSLYEHSMRCPLIMAGPDIPAGVESFSFTYLFDVYPTICDLLGVDPPEGLAGHSLRPLFDSPETQVRDSVFLAYRNLMRSVRDQRWKLLKYPQVNHTQLFDLENDPDEMHNLANDPAQADRLAQLTQKMAEWQMKVGDKQPLAVDSPQPLRRDLTGTPRQPDQWQPRWIVEKYFESTTPAQN
ncbi:MAG: DUF4976 domain-containing protein, partial [Planctomycetales bacterium]|nr:DUF4976 domain-containing protein [Planctomycetales bacterium]